MFQTKVLEKIKTHFSPKVVSFVGKMWKNIVKPDSSQMII